MKRTDREGKHEGRDEDIQKKDCPLSCEGWILLVSHEIDRHECSNKYDFQTPTLLVAIFIAFVSWMFAVRSVDLHVQYINQILHDLQLFTYCIAFLLCIYILNLFCNILIYYPKTKKRVKSLENIRKKIISADLTASNEIREQWDEINNV